MLFPDDGITKADLAAYYGGVAEWMLPHVRDRPVSMQRFPDGIAGKGFFHKDVPDYFPDWIKRVEVPKANGTVTHALIDRKETLLYLANQNTITPHVWLTRADRLHQPDRLVFDLDPAPGSDFASVRRAARWTAELLDELGLVPFAQVTGSKGIHIWTPLRRRAGLEEVRELARGAAEVLAERRPRELTVSSARPSATGASWWMSPVTGTHRPPSRRTRYAPVRVPRWPPRSSVMSCRTRSCAPIAGRLGTFSAGWRARAILGGHAFARARDSASAPARRRAGRVDAPEPFSARLDG